MIGLLLALLLAFATSPWSVPALLRAQAPRWAAAQLGRTLEVGAIRFDPAHLRLHVADLRLRDAAGRTDALRIADVELRLGWDTLWRGHPVIAALRLRAPQLRVVRQAGGGFDFDDIIARLRAGPPRAGPPPRLQLDALTLSDGSVRFDDLAAAVHTRVDALALQLDGVSTIPGAPPARGTLNARIDGAPLQARFSGAPLERRRALHALVSVRALPLQAFAGYQPRTLPLRLAAASASATLQLEGPPAQPQQLTLGGELKVDGAQLVDAHGRALGGWRALRLQLGRVLPLARSAELGALSVDGLQLTLRRDALPLAAAGAGDTAKAPASSPVPAWQFGLTGVTLRDGSMRWVDPTARVDWRATLPQLTLGALSWPLHAPVAVAATLDGPHGAQLALSGHADLDQARIDVDLRHVDPQLALPYAPQLRALAPRGEFALRQARLDWAAKPRQLQLQIAGAELVAPRAGPHGELRAASVALRDVRADLLERRVTIGELLLQQPQASVSRDPAGSWSVAGWIAPPPASAAAPATPAPAPRTAQRTTKPPRQAATPWRLQLREARVVDGSAYLADTKPATPVVVAVGALSAKLRDFTWPATTAAALQFSARVEDRMPPPTPSVAPTPSTAPDGGARPPLPLGNAPAPTLREAAAAAGTVRFDGHVEINPLTLRGRLDADQLPLQAAAPYLPPNVALRVLRARGAAHGQLDVRGAALRFTGDAALDSVAADAAGQPLLSWRSLQLQRLQLRTAPRQPLQLDIGQVALDRFYARVVLGADARLNLAQVWHGSAAPAAAAPASGTAAASSAASAGAPRLHVGGIVLSRGRVDYTDYFVKPNYATSLDGVSGHVGAFGSGDPAQAAVSLRASAQGDAPVSLDGSLNPLTEPPHLDLVGSMREFQLAPLSPYAARYAGYQIARGQLAMRVHYRIDAAGELNADNQLTLAGLTLGAHVDSPDATHLPVALAVALLTDPDGLIKLNLPVSGSLHDPKFDFGALVAKVVRNLFVRVLTAPFALLAHLGAGASGAQLSHVAFTPGRAELAPAIQDQLQLIARALQQRPALIVTITGDVDPQRERQAWRDAEFERRLLAHWKRHQPRTEQALTRVPPDARDAAIAALYRDTALPDKPRTALGLPAVLPPQRMQALLLGAVPDGDDQLLGLAMRRAIVLRDALKALGIPASRQYIGAPELRAGAAPEATLQLSLP